MQPLNHPVRRLLDNAQRRFLRSRSGSVLILVVALLVLMALIGTAYMTMAQFDRAAATQHTFNTEVDLLLEGVINQVKGIVGGDLFVNGQFRPAQTTTNSGGTPIANLYNSLQGPTFKNYNGVGYDQSVVAVRTGQTNAGDTWLASRVPELPTNNATPGGSNYPMWTFITAPINGSGVFDQPYWGGKNNQDPSNNSYQYSYRSQLHPTETGGISQPYVYIDGQLWPAFEGPSGGKNFFMAADADGDGMADSGMVKILTLDGITYYAAVRIVDNSAGIDASIAQTPNPLGSFIPPANASNIVGQMPGDLSPVNLDLEGMVTNPGSKFAAWAAPQDLYGNPSVNSAGLIYNYRFNRHAPINAAVSDSGPRLDFFYMAYPYSYPSGGQTVYYYFDQQWLQLGSRLRHPGYIAYSAANPTDPTTFYQALPITESMTMARDFILRDPTIPSSTMSSSILEMRMPNSTFLSAPTTPYQPYDTINWFDGNFNYYNDYQSLKTPSMPIRALLTAQNPVSNFCPAKFNMSPTGSPSYQFGDVVTGANGYKYVCINPGVKTQPNVAFDPDQWWQDTDWAWEPWTNAPTKTSVNTATFQQLYAAYWAVMADQYMPANGAIPGQWLPAFPNYTAGNTTTGRMFRNPIRDGASSISATTKPSTPALSNQQVLQLRAAIAAVNTIGLRHGDASKIASYGTNDVISRTVPIQVPPGPGSTGISFQATVFSTERQPFITQVYARNDPTVANSWMAVELYNPYPNPIQLKNWVLATVNRSIPGSLTLSTSGLGTLQAAAPTLGAVPSIAPGERVVLMSSTTPPNTINIGTPPPLCRFVQCTGLSNAFGKELVLMRPRRADGTYIPNPGLRNNLFAGAAESSTTPVDLVPVDSYDFTNMPPNAATPGAVQEWWYDRPSDPSANKQWHFVFPGPWNLKSGATGPKGTAPPTWSGTYVSNPIPATRDFTKPMPPKGGSWLGTPQQSTTPAQQTPAVPWANYEDVGIQINNVDFGGPQQPNPNSTTNSLPLGTFPRNGDLLQVTFIGAYRLSPLTNPTTIYELNTLSSDSAMATACDENDATNLQEPICSQGSPQIIAENVGRFCPIDTTDAGLATPKQAVDDFAPAPFGSTINPAWRYHWATHLFDFLTVQAPQDDYFPNVDPWLIDKGYSNNQFAGRYPLAVKYGYPVPVANVTTAANAGLIPANPGLPKIPASEDTAPVDGLVNVNTAPWRVLAAVPWVPATQTNWRNQNALIAMAITNYRDGNPGLGIIAHGPFKSLFELGEIPTGGGKLRDILQAANTSTFTLPQGNLTPLQPSATPGTAPAPPGDFQAVFNTMTRVSNLVTTRSDSYTAYVLIQGWRNAETPNPHLVVQRRAAVIIDRSGVTPSNKLPSSVNIPMN